MTKRTRRKRCPAFKAKVALAAVKGAKTLAKLAPQFDVILSRRASVKSANPIIPLTGQMMSRITDVTPVSTQHTPFKYRKASETTTPERVPCR